ncbi:hypothetical protein GDO78_003584 [Eleutherodactylus coqui]|uniref:Uncharacterized protein n=1 Tax=Eleutherodactylus coqui TaxID=57060 RepID=A0A8J6ESR1_ELECQ|nr:hypothetical protein GDO78_003584 [Eleutherodactylus coqui]
MPCPSFWSHNVVSTFTLVISPVKINKTLPLSLVQTSSQPCSFVLWSSNTLVLKLYVIHNIPLQNYTTTLLSNSNRAGPTFQVFLSLEDSLLLLTSPYFSYPAFYRLTTEDSDLPSKAHWHLL